MADNTRRKEKLRASQGACARRERKKQVLADPFAICSVVFDEPATRSKEGKKVNRRLNKTTTTKRKKSEIKKCKFFQKNEAPHLEPQAPQSCERGSNFFSVEKVL